MNTITITLTPAAHAVIEKMDRLPTTMMQAIAHGMDEANQVVWRKIATERLTGVGPFPVAEHRLGECTDEMFRRFLPIAPVIQGNTVTAALASGVRYAAVHEFGGVFTRTTKPGTVRLRTKKDGSLMRQGANGRLAVFAKSSHKRAVSRDYAGGKRYQVVIPARAPITTGIRENMDVYSRLVSDAIVQDWNKGGAHV